MIISHVKIIFIFLARTQKISSISYSLLRDKKENKQKSKPVYVEYNCPISMSQFYSIIENDPKVNKYVYYNILHNGQ